jgi:hypothetical protein
MIYNPKDYWEKRLSDKFNLSRVGTLGFSKYYINWGNIKKSVKVQRGGVSYS